MKKIIALLLVLVVLLSVSGCWDLKELNEIGVVLMIGIDTNSKGDGFEITAHVHTPLAGPGGEAAGETGIENISIISAQGQTVLDAFRNMRGRVAFRMMFDHARLIVIGEDLARKGVKPAMDILLRTTQIRLNSVVMVCEGSAKEFLQTAPEVSESFHLEVEGILRNEEIWSKSMTTTVLQFTQDLLNQGKQPVATKAFTIEPDVSDPVLDEEQDETQQGVVVVEGLAVFNDDQLVDWLTGTETIGYRYINGNGGEMMLVIPWHSAKVSIEVDYEACSKRLRMNGDEPVMEVQVMVSGTIQEYTGYINLSDRDVLDELESLFAAQMENILRSTDQKAKELGVDFLGYGSIIHHKNPRVWTQLNDKWREIFPTIETVFDVRASIGTTGVITTPLPR